MPEAGEIIEEHREDVEDSRRDDRYDDHNHSRHRSRRNDSRSRSRRRTSSSRKYSYDDAYDQEYYSRSGNRKIYRDDDDRYDYHSSSGNKKMKNDEDREEGEYHEEEDDDKRKYHHDHHRRRSHSCNRKYDDNRNGKDDRKRHDTLSHHKDEREKIINEENRKSYYKNNKWENNDNKSQKHTHSSSIDLEKYHQKHNRKLVTGKEESNSLRQKEDLLNVEEDLQIWIEKNKVIEERRKKRMAVLEKFQAKLKHENVDHQDEDGSGEVTSSTYSKDEQNNKIFSALVAVGNEEEDDEFVFKTEEEKFIEERRKRMAMITEKYKSSVPRTSTAFTPGNVTPPSRQYFVSSNKIHSKPMNSPPKQANTTDDPNLENELKMEMEETIRENEVVEDNHLHAHKPQVSKETRELLSLREKADQEFLEDTQSEISETRNPVKPKKVLAEDDMFAGEDDDDDMFAEPTTDTNKRRTSQQFGTTAIVRASNDNLVDNWDDQEGYYKTILGEVLDNRYHVTSILGRGVFSSVIKAKDTFDLDSLVAIKIIRSNDLMYKAGLKEYGLLKKLEEADPGGRKHIVKCFRYFEHKRHLCLAFESLGMNLRDVLRKFGKDVGLNIKAVKVYAQQLFLSLSLLKKCNVIHADIKPDNILVNEKMSTLKLCDLGSASEIDECEITPYLVSRFYRAPEIIIGLPYDYAVDMWSVAVSLYELYTGKVLFAGKTNNQMLKLMMELKGKIPNKILRRGTFTSEHFDDNLNFKQVDVDPITKKETCRIVENIKSGRDLKSRLFSSSGSKTNEETVLLGHFVDLLDKSLQLNPEKRLTVKEALLHTFISGKS